jgi:hypothetical protein
MQKVLTLAALLVLASPSPTWGVGSFSLSASDVISTSSLSESLSVAKLSGLTFDTVTVGTVALALEIEEMNPSAQSPHHNVITITGGVTNSATVLFNSGVTTLQQTAGGANVTMSLNNIVVAPGTLVTTVPSVNASNNPTLLLTGIANQPFTVTNSYWFAQTLTTALLTDAFIAGSASAGNAIAADILTVGLNEFSPHHNLGRTNTAVNSAAISGNFGIVTVQQTAGFGNVTQSLNTLIVGSGLIGSTGVTVQP